MMPLSRLSCLFRPTTRNPQPATVYLSKVMYIIMYLFLPRAKSAKPRKPIESIRPNTTLFKTYYGEIAFQTILRALKT
ncbi:hypothetical protein K445DRAFT_312642 [Daldinia sp. EC12]|nr:hypothetical protein K445DRAFT_312642 [Daldinia sp. EC12]